MDYIKSKFSKTVVFIVAVSLLLMLIIPTGIIFGNSDTDLKEEYEKALIALGTAQEEVARAESDLGSLKPIEAEARANLESAAQKLNVANDNFAGASPEVEKLKEKLAFAQAAAGEANSLYESIIGTGTEEEINAAKNAVDNAKSELSSKTAEYEAANSNLANLQSELDKAKAEYESAKSAADEASANLLNAETILNAKNENLKNAQAEVERTKAELEAYQTEAAEEAEDEENETSDEEATTGDETTTETEDTEEVVTEEENGETSSEGEISDEEVPEEEVAGDETTTETEDTEETVTEEENGEISSEGEISDEETIQENEETISEVIEGEEVEEEVTELISELVPEDDTTTDETVVKEVIEETVEVTIDIEFSVDENGYVPAGQVTTFNVSIIGATPFQYFWDFGDGSSSTSQNPQYAYTSDGNYTLSLTMLDVDGNAYNKSITVNVSDYNPTTTEYWISADAAEDGTGTIDNPFTIDVALLHVVNGDILYFLPGTYNVSVNLDSIGTGTEGVPIEIKTEEEPSDETKIEEELPGETEIETEEVAEEASAEPEEEDLTIKFIAYDDVIFDGQSTLEHAFYYSSDLSYLSFYNFIFMNYLNSAIYIDNEDVTNISIVDNTFVNNETAIDINMDSGLNIQNNIIVDNDAGVVISSDDVNIEHNIIAFNEEGIVVDDTRNNIIVDYNDVFGNGTDYQGTEAGANDISVDPEFADIENLDFTILEDSPLYENKIIKVSSTDKEDYPYGGQVTITGSGYEPYQDLIIRILRADGTFVEDINITTDANGNFTYDGYSVDYPGTDYLIQIMSVDENILEVLSFTDCHPSIKLKKSGLYYMASGDYAGFTLYKDGGGAVGSEQRIYSSYGYVTWNLSSYGTYWIKETHVPNGYKKMDDIKVETKYDKEYYFERSNEKIKGEITLNKTGLDAGAIAGFTLYNSLNNPVGSEKTVTGNGSVSWTGLSWGTYKIVETTTPAGYTKITDITGIVVGSTKQVYSFNRENVKIWGKVKIKKSGLTDLAPGDYAGFTLYFSDGTAFGSEQKITGDGFVVWEKVPYGTGYYIKETHAPEGYAPIADITGISITFQDQSVQFKRENVKCKGIITLNKSGLESTDTAGFTLYNSSGGQVGSERIVTGNGSASWTSLPWDTYKIVETTTPDGYDPIADITGIVVGATQQIYSFSKENIKKSGSITLNKRGLGSTDTAGFTLYDSLNNPVGSEKTVTGNGSVSWTDLGWDTYKIVETTTPAGYAPIADITGIVVGPDEQVYSFSRVNEKELGKIILTKSGLLGDDEVTFTLTGTGYSQQRTVSATNTVATWSDLEYGTYNLTETPDPGNTYTYLLTVTPSGPYVIGVGDGKSLLYTPSAVNTPLKGKIILTKSGLEGSDLVSITLKKGSVTIETKTGVGNGVYTFANLAFGSDYSITETYASGNTYTYGVATQTPDNPISVPSSTPVSVSLVNHPNKGSIVVTKSGLVGSDTVEFTLSGTGYSQSYTVSAASPVATWSDLEYGTYSLTETPDPGNTYTYLLTVTPDGPYEIGVGNGKSLLYTLDAKNTPEELFGSITLNKSGLDSTATAGFTLYNSGGTTVGGEKTVIGNGSVSWTNLPFDTYKIVETTVPGGYSKMSDITGIVVGAVQQVYSFSRVNTKTPVLGSITLNKSGLDSTDIAGFTLYNSSGTSVDGEKIVIGNGSVTWTDLPWDIYEISETTVPAGYSKMSNIAGIVVGATQKVYSFDRVNTKTPVLGSITLNKSGLDSTNVAGFTLYNSSGDAVGGEKTITGNGVIVWTDLPWDTYKIVETAVPGGYNKMSDITGIVVGDVQQSFSFDRTNIKTPPPPPPASPPTTPPLLEVLGIQELPFTGMSPFVLISGISTIIAGVVLVVVSMLRRKKRGLESSS